MRIRPLDIQVYQGDDEDALKNILVGDFQVEGLTPTAESNEVLCRMRLDLDGIPEVTAIEKRSGVSKHITIANALCARTPEEVAAGKKRIEELYRGSSEEKDEDEAVTAAAAPGNVIPIDAAVMEPSSDPETERLLERSRRLLDGMHADDCEEAIARHEEITAALESGDKEALRRASAELRDLLFFIEGSTAG